MYAMNPPDDEHGVARNMQRNMINIINSALSWNMKSNRIKIRTYKCDAGNIQRTE